MEYGGFVQITRMDLCAHSGIWIWLQTKRDRGQTKTISIHAIHPKKMTHLLQEFGRHRARGNEVDAPVESESQ